MATRTTKLALVLGLAGAFAMTATASFAKTDKTKYPKDSYEAWGAEPGKPPVPGFALHGYKPGLCWKVSRGNGDRQFGDYVPCSEWKKKN
jgi:hypothetical protein